MAIKNVIKITLFCSSNVDEGWTENIYYASDAVPFFTEVGFLNSVKGWVLARRKMSGPRVNFNTIRYQMITDNAGKLYKPSPSIIYSATNSVFLGPGTAPLGPLGSEPGRMALYLDAYDGSFTHRRRLVIRALDGTIVNTHNSGTDPHNPLSEYGYGVLSAYINSLGGSFTRGGAPRSFQIRGYNKSGLVQSKVLQLLWESGPPPTVLVDTGALIPNVGLGDILHIHGVTGCGAPTFNGDFTVSKPLPQGSVTAYTLVGKGNCCVDGFYDFSKAVIYPKTWDWFNIAEIDYVKYDGARTGSPFGRTRGRSRKRCCR